MDRCMEEIGAAVLDAGEPLSYRTLGMRSNVPPSASLAALAQFSADHDAVKCLRVLITRASVSSADDSETAAAQRDPRARVLRLAVEDAQQPEDVLCQQVYALYSQERTHRQAEDEVTAVATACWAQERQTRNEVLDKLQKHQPLTAAAKALYASGVACAEATARQDFGDEQGEETISAFDSFNTSSKKSSSSKKSFFKSSGTEFKSSSGGNGSKSAAAAATPGKVSAASMNNVLTVDSDDEEDDETDAPVFVKKTSTNGRGKRIISDDDDEEDEAPKEKAASTPAPKSRNVKRKLNASPAETKKAKKPASDSEEERPSNKKTRSDSEEDAGSASPEAAPVIPTKRKVLVTKTRINEQGYMVTEKTYEEVELTPEEVEKEKKAAQKKMAEKKKKAAAEKATKAKKEAKKHNAPPKQRDLRSFFSMK